MKPFELDDDQCAQMLKVCFREMLWLSVAWNDHNFSDGTMYRKANAIFEFIGRDTDIANQLLSDVDKIIDDKFEIDGANQ